MPELLKDVQYNKMKYICCSMRRYCFGGAAFAIVVSHFKASVIWRVLLYIVIPRLLSADG